MYPTVSAFASLAELFPLAPVYFVKVIPLPNTATLSGSWTDLKAGSNAAETSELNMKLLESTKFRLVIVSGIPVRTIISFITKDNHLDSAPVAPLLPISSLSKKQTTDVYSGISVKSKSARYTPLGLEN